MITAAHCTEGEAFQNSIESGARRIELADGRMVLADLLIRHPGGESFDRTPDVALIRLSEEIPDLEPIPLYEGNDERGRVVLMPGWGGFGNGLDGLTEGDGLLRVAENRVLSTSKESAVRESRRHRIVPAYVRTPRGAVWSR
ncbi:MAG TPA: trypsin-like peptidase domain-containing protein [Rhodothermales bacterium]|nr:trypsin-like peptidase domain-containing protein [Rhodothermales bacterium]